MNSSIDKYYGSKDTKSVSYLEFGSIDLDNSKKRIWDFRLHQQAYDWLMLSRYSNDIITYHKMVEFIQDEKQDEIFKIYKSDIHHQDDFYRTIVKLCCLSVFNNNRAFIELGQTVFGCIDAMDFAMKYMQTNDLYNFSFNLEQINWFGIDISDYFNRLSKIYHQGYNITTTDNFAKIDEHIDVFFAKGVTMLYAFKTIEEMIDCLLSSNIAFFDYSFSTCGDQIDSIGTGKNVSFLDFGNFNNKCIENNCVMYVNRTTSKYDKDKKRIFSDCILGKERYCKRFISKYDTLKRNLLNSNPGIWKPLLSIDILPTEEWIPAKLFYDTLVS